MPRGTVQDRHIGEVHGADRGERRREGRGKRACVAQRWRHRSRHTVEEGVLLSDGRVRRAKVRGDGRGRRDHNRADLVDEPQSEGRDEKFVEDEAFLGDDLASRLLLRATTASETEIEEVEGTEKALMVEMLPDSTDSECRYHAVEDESFLLSE